MPGGVSSPLQPEVRDRILQALPEALEIAQRALTGFKRMVDDFGEEIRTFGNFPSMFMSLVTPDGGLELYDGKLRIGDAQGNIIADQLDPGDWPEFIGEAVEPWTYLKFPYYKPLGYPEGMYRVGPLARLNLVDHCGTPLADAELAEFKALQRGAVLSSFHFHYARLIEIVYALERMEQLLNDPDILDTHVRAEAGPNAPAGTGVSEAPRGTLIHHYCIDENGLMQSANLMIATGHNNLAMNRGVLQVAKHFIQGEELPEGMLNRIEAVVRAFDPCLSCSTHALGRMPLHVQLCGPGGEVVRELRRD